MIKFKQVYQFCLLLLILLTNQACQSTAGFKEERQKVMDLHDKVMEDSEKAVTNKILLDTIMMLKMPALLAAKPSMDTLSEKVKILSIIKKLDNADEMMMDWMNEFEPDVENKNSDQALKYFQKELAKIKALDQQFRNVIQESDTYIKQAGLKQDTLLNTHQGHKH